VVFVVVVDEVDLSFSKKKHIGQTEGQFRFTTMLCNVGNIGEHVCSDWCARQGEWCDEP
jgi:hypothetical protein